MSAVAPDGRPLRGGVLALDAYVPGDARELAGVLGDPRNYTEGYVMHRPMVQETSITTRVDEVIAAGAVVYTARLVQPVNGMDAGAVVGTSAIGIIDVANAKAHVGWTMWHHDVWGSVVNPTAKLLMLGHLFDDCGMGRVQIQTDAVNTRSQAAIARLGAVREGVLRRDMRRADGSWRDTVVFSVVVDEWPAVKAGLAHRAGVASPL